MQRSLNIGEQLRRDLKTKGVRVDSLVVDITDRIVVISGEAYSYYDLQLIQLHSRSLLADYRVVVNISVMVGDAERQSDRAASEASSELHRVRGELQQLTLSLHMLDRLLEQSDVSASRALLKDLLAVTPINSHSSSRGEANSDYLIDTKILVVEDDSRQNLLLSSLLTHLGARVSHAANATEAYRIIQRGFAVQIVLLDVDLAGQDGLEVANWLRQHASVAMPKIVVISGHEPKATEDAIARQLVDAWLPKPLNVERLLQTLRSLRIVK